MQKKYFGTDGIRGRMGDVTVHPEFMLKLAFAVGKVLARPGETIVIGKDTRISGYLIESALQAGLIAAGVNVALVGPMPTPAIAYLTRTLGAVAGIVISASHNPFEDNGIKFFNAAGYKLSDELECAIEAQIDAPMKTVSAAALGKAVRKEHAAGRYVEFCKATLPSRVSLKGLKVVVDCANGATYHVAGPVFEELGAEVVLLNAEPNGVNINVDCGSLHPETLAAAVIKHQADCGVALDGDGDRLIMVDHQGAVVNGDQLLAVLAMDYYKQYGADFGVVGTLMTNLALEKLLATNGVGFERAAVGDRYVMALLKEKGWELGGESSGHLINLALSTTGDGIVSALQILRVIKSTGESLQQLAECMQLCPQSMVNITVDNATLRVEMPDVKACVQAAQSTLGNQGRILVRASGTEPLIRVMVEAEGMSQEAVHALAQTIADDILAKIA